jgi:hypothetical protein
MPAYEIPLTEGLSTPLEMSTVPVYTPGRGPRDSAAKPALTVIEFATTQLLHKFEPGTRTGLGLLLATNVEAPHLSELPEYHARWPLAISTEPTRKPKVVNIIFGDAGKSIVGYVYDRDDSELLIERFTPGRGDHEDPLAQRFMSLSLSQTTRQYPEGHMKEGKTAACIAVRYAVSEEKKPGSRPRAQKTEVPDRPEDISDHVIALAKAALKEANDPRRAHPNGRFPNFFENRLLRAVCSNWALAHHSVRGQNL